MIDTAFPVVSHLRISVTQQCDMDCFYCHHEGQTHAHQEISLETVRSIARDSGDLGIRFVKITGGEPLLRKDIFSIIEAFAEIPAIEEISMTSNGLLLEKMANGLKQAGLSRINIGCDTIFSPFLSKRFDQVLPGIEAAFRAGLNPVKLNMVILKGINDKEIPLMIDYARQYHFILQLIELIPNGDPSLDQYFLPVSEIEKTLEKLADKIVVRELQSRKQYTINGAIVEAVGPSKHDFCGHCLKIRITSDGFVKPCLRRSDNLVPYTGIESIKEAIGLKRRYIHVDD